MSSKEKSFTNKWSEAIQQHGYTSIPNLLLFHRIQLKLTVSEVYVILCIESFRWDDRQPYPSMDSLAQRTNLSKRQVRLLISRLENKGLVRRNYRKSNTSTYSLEGLIAKLDTFATSSLPPGQKQPPDAAKMRHMRRSILSSKEDPDNNKNKRQIIKNEPKNGSIESAEAIMRRRFIYLSKYPKSNDFVKSEEN